MAPPRIISSPPPPKNNVVPIAEPSLARDSTEKTSVPSAPGFSDVRAAQEALQRIRGDAVSSVSRLYRPYSDPVAQAKAEAMLMAAGELFIRPFPLNGD